MRTSLTFALAAGLLAPSCTTAPTVAEVEAAVVAQAPSSHRATGTTCPAGRGPGALTPGCPDAGVPPACTSDADCTAGRNGRCLPTPGLACAPQCSYDACQSDADCAGEACICRMSSDDPSANVCATGNCATDADCGPGGFCSPSGLLDACGIGYYCHTPNDTCLDDADCASSEGCSFDPHALAWACAVTCTRPP